MGKWIRALLGYYRVRIRGAAPELALNRLLRGGIYFWAVDRVDDFTCDISVRKKEAQKLLELVKRVQHEGEIIRETGLTYHFRGLKRRKLFVCTVLLILVTAFVLPGFTWFLKVEGNETVPAKEILDELEDLGVGFGTWNRSIKPQQLKYKMLNRIPKLEWLTVNTSGLVATVVVRERPPAKKIIDRRLVTNIVAEQACIIDEMQVLSGQSLCKVGQTVLEGQLLVSGYADWGHCTQATRALAEIYGRTWRKQNAVIPAVYDEKVEVGATETRFALEIGRKRINFYTDSGIWGMNCDKMYERLPLTLPGGFTFPVTLIRETATARTLQEAQLPANQAQQLLLEETRRAVEADMLAGVIVQSNLAMQKQSDLYQLTGSYECREIVGKAVPALLFEERD